MPNSVGESIKQKSLARDLNTLEVFLLFLVSDGVSTTYKLMVHAGMSAGLTGPALKRMRSSGLLSCTPGPRKAMQYALTELGADALKNALKSRHDSDWRPEQHSIFENAPRDVLLAWLFSSQALAFDLIEVAGEELEAQGNMKEREAVDLLETVLRRKKKFLEKGASHDRGVLTSMIYRCLKMSLDAALLRAQANAVTSLAPVFFQLQDGLKSLETNQFG